MLRGQLPKSKLMRGCSVVVLLLLLFIKSAVSGPGNELKLIAYAENEVIQPHGQYTEETLMCGLCHRSHWGLAPGLLSSSEISAVCYQCHGSSGISSISSSSYDIEGEFQRIESGHRLLTCSGCHNPHDGGKDAVGNQLHLPKLLEVKIDDNLYSTSQEGFCFTCHPDQKNYYPAEGRGHNSLGLRGEAEISCLACHESHGSDLPKMLKALPKGGGLEVTGVNSSACLSCHRNELSSVPDNAWDGELAFNGSGGKDDCFQCHNVHGTPADLDLPSGVNSKYLTASYDVAYGLDRSAQFSAENFNLCFDSGCHSSTDLLYGNSNFSDVNRGNLHLRHLNQNSADGNAVCKECHRPHGAIATENPFLRARVGFPAQSVLARPAYGLEFLSYEPGEGSCNLVCHNITHVGENPGPGEVNSIYTQQVPEPPLELLDLSPGLEAGEVTADGVSLGEGGGGAGSGSDENPAGKGQEMEFDSVSSLDDMD